MAEPFSLPKIGPKTIEKLQRLGILTPGDLLYHFPHRYLDFSKITNIANLKVDENYTITAKVLDFKNIYTRNHKNIQMAQVADATGQISLTWFNQPYLQKNIQVGQTYSFAGTVSLYRLKKTIISPEYGQYHTGKIVAVYPETKGLSSKWFRSTIQSNLEQLLSSIVDPLPQKVRQNFHLTDLKTALTQIHLPQDPAHLETARLRLALQEILSLQVHSYLSKKNWLSQKPKIIIRSNSDFDQKIDSFIGKLPYKLTVDQKKCWREIKTDLLSTKSITNRLIEGDVGSGKTIVAALAAYLNSLNNLTTLILAPTEILAKQHYQSFKKLFKDQKIPLRLLTATAKQKLSKLPQNTILISTHAIIFQKDELKVPVSLLIIDEQHKFGVKQRSFLSSSSAPPHTLTMTATPIPRTISLTMLGNLSLSTIETMPEGRQKVKTFLVPNHKTPDCYSWLNKHLLETKEQAFIVCPFIELSETLTTVKSAQREYDHLSKNIFTQQKLALIHSKINQSQRDLIIKKFLDKKINILITTPIIEVGIDIPNATTIIIQSADRFGLAQLHQLRGRVGRSHRDSYCYLFTDSTESKVLERLKYMENHHLGSEIAQYDLKIRGPGELFSTLQHGFPSLKIADFTDSKIINLSQSVLEYLINHHPDFNLKSLELSLDSEAGLWQSS